MQLAMAVAMMMQAMGAAAEESRRSGSHLRARWMESSKRCSDDVDSLHEKEECIPQLKSHPISKKLPIPHLLSMHPECPSLHFLLFYKSLIRQEHTLMLESLHRYFHYRMISEQKERAERSVMLAQSS